MLKPHSFIHHRDITHEDLFVARYERLLAWAMSLTEGVAMEAEDLLHDAFIQFTLSRPDLGSIENIDGYLRQTLRNLHVSKCRRAAQKRLRPLCAADYDSAELSLRVEEIHAGLGAREELRLICEYAIARRISSKAASALILRFFHGYLPAEIAGVMLLGEAAGRGAVKQWLSLARREARQYLHDPQSLKFIGQSSGEKQPVQIPRGCDDLEFIRSLREAIFAAPQTQGCLRARELKANPSVEIDLQTVAEATERQRGQASRRSSPPAAVVERDEVAVTRLPVDTELRRHFTASGVSDDRIDEEIRRFASDTLAHSRQAARHAGALSSLSARFSNVDSFDPAARTKWRRLLGSHARALSAEILALRASLAPVFAATASSDEVAEPGAIESYEDLRRAAERIASICAESDRALIAAFSLSSDSSPAATVRTPGFWLNLRRGELLAAAINRYLSAFGCDAVRNERIAWRGLQLFSQ